MHHEIDERDGYLEQRLVAPERILQRKSSRDLPARGGAPRAVRAWIEWVRVGWEGVGVGEAAGWGAERSAQWNGVRWTCVPCAGWGRVGMCEERWGRMGRDGKGCHDGMGRDGIGLDVMGLDRM